MYRILRVLRELVPMGYGIMGSHCSIKGPLPADYPVQHTTLTVVYVT